MISFVIITCYWLAQHRIMRHVTLERRSVVYLLLAWTLVIVFLPFPTALIAQNGDDPAVKTLYLGTTMAGTLLLGALASVVQRHPEITDGHDDTDPADSLATALIFVVALGIMLAAPGTGYGPLVLLLLSDHLADAWRRLRGREPRHHSMLRGLRGRR